VWTVGKLRFQILKFLNTEVEKIRDLEKRERDLPKEPEDLTFKITTPSLGKTKYLIAKAKREAEEFIKSASENPVLWTGMKDASAEGKKRKTRC
jgi:hypothetical protein